MQLNQKIEIDILEFFRTGKFDYIKLGQTKEWIINNFPDPDNDEYNYNIWQYGNIEFHFSEDRLYSIFTDYIQELDGGNSLIIDKWILENPDQLTLLHVVEKLNDEKIDFSIIHNKTLNNVIEIEIIESKVKLGFIDYNEANINSNLFSLNSFSLYKQL